AAAGGRGRRWTSWPGWTAQSAASWSYPLHLLRAEESVRFDQQDQEHEGVGRDEREVVAQPGGDVGLVDGGDRLDQADGEAADDGARDAVEPADDDRRERLQRDDPGVLLQAGARR